MFFNHDVEFSVRVLQNKNKNHVVFRYRLTLEQAEDQQKRLWVITELEWLRCVAFLYFEVIQNHGPGLLWAGMELSPEEDCRGRRGRVS